MADLPRFPMSQQSRHRLNELLDQAPSLGLDPTAVADGGPVALRALLALKKAHESEVGPRRDGYLAQVQDALSVLQHRDHPELTRQIQTRLLALQGRGSDTEIAHVARGELVVPVELQTEEVLTALRKAAAPYGVPFDMLRVGSALNHINPDTGAPEFGVMDWISGLFKREEPEIRIVPPFDDPAVNAEEIEAAREVVRNRPAVNPLIRGVSKLIQPLTERKQEEWNRKMELRRVGPGGGRRG